MIPRHSSVVTIDHRFAQLDSGIVDEDVDREAFGVEMLERGDDRRFVGDVEGARLDAYGRRFAKDFAASASFFSSRPLRTIVSAGRRKAARHCEAQGRPRSR